jgi:hypothetical protein
MGRGFIKQKNALKKQYMEPLRKYCEQLEKENAALKNDPQTVIGQFIGQFRELYGQNLRLSALCAALIKKAGESAVLTKDEMEAFQQKRINIKWEVADGETPETAKQFTFTYELQDAPPNGQPVQPTENPDSIPECADPNCTLPKELKHRHMPEPPQPEPHDGGPTVVAVNEVPSPWQEVEPGDTVNVDGKDFTVTSVDVKHPE